MVRSSKTPAFWSVDCPFRRKFRVMKVSLERCFGVSLPLPLFPGPEDGRMSLLKKFCSAPLEREAHEWDIHLRRSGRRTRYSIWMSLFLFRKTLPSSAPDLSDFMDKVEAPSPEPDPVFMDFIRKEVPRLFKSGWDKGYERQVELAVTSTSACLQKSRVKGGCRMYWLELYHQEARSAFMGYLRGEDDVYQWEDLDPLDHARLSAVPTAGKVRLLSIPSATAQLLLPFHKTFYNRLSRFSWLLRGDAKSSSFKDFLYKHGDVYVSGDYESATDCLNQNVQKEILRLVLQSCAYVPNNIRRSAMDSLSVQLSCCDIKRTVKVQTGQMMGYPISFPLLCLVNYLAFRFATMDESIPVKINGDDIVFRATPRVARVWMDQVSKSGLRLSKGKTLIDKRIFTLNSALFEGGKFKVRALPFIRSKALFGTDDGYTSLPGRFGSFAPGFGQERKFRLQSMFLRQNVGYIDKSRRSLNRGLGMRVPRELLKSSRFWRREVDYLSLPKEKKPPPTRSMWEMQPEGYHIEHFEEKKKLDKEEQKELVDAVVESAWRIPNHESFEAVYDGGCNRPLLNRRIRDPLLTAIYGNVRNALKESDERIFNEYSRTQKRLYPQWVKDKVSNPSSLANDRDELSTPVPPINLGPTTVWEISESRMVAEVVQFEGEALEIDYEELSQRLTLVSPGNKIKMLKNGIGIGPPTCF